MASVRKFAREIIPQATKSLELSEAAYNAGELNFLHILVVRRTFSDSKIRLIEAKGVLAQASAKVYGLVLTGGLDAPQDYSNGDEIRGASLIGQLHYRKHGPVTTICPRLWKVSSHDTVTVRCW